MSKYLILISVLTVQVLIQSCKSIKYKVEILGVNDYLNDNDSIDARYLKLNFVFSSRDTIPFIMDWAAICKNNYKVIYDESVLAQNVRKYSKESIISKIHKSQVVIENSNHKMKFFNEPKTATLKKYVHSFEDNDCSYQELGLITKEKPLQLSLEVLESDLRIDKLDNRIRLHYIFKPGSNSELASSYYLISNWIDLPPQ